MITLTYTYTHRITHTELHIDIMSLQHIQTRAELDTILKSYPDHLIFLDFYADWCGPCKKLMPTLTKLSEQYNPKIIILKVNVDDEKATSLIASFDIRGIPRIICYYNSNIIKDMTGANPQVLIDLAQETLTH